eukprot:c17500_g1_i1 orf=216-506(-)
MAELPVTAFGIQKMGELRVIVLALLLSMLLAVQLPPGEAIVQACPDICQDVKYVTCTSSPNTQFPASCNCCVFKNSEPDQQGCQLHLSDGSVEDCT